MSNTTTQTLFWVNLTSNYETTAQKFEHSRQSPPNSLKTTQNSASKDTLKQMTTTSQSPSMLLRYSAISEEEESLKSSWCNHSSQTTTWLACTTSKQVADNRLLSSSSRIISFWCSRPWKNRRNSFFSRKDLSSTISSMWWSSQTHSWWKYWEFTKWIWVHPKLRSSSPRIW